MNEDDKRKYVAARKRVEAKIGFYIHAGIFVAVNGMLIAINMTTTPQEIWFIYPLLGWGMGLLAHLVLVFFPFSTTDWKKRMIEKEMNRME